MVKTPTEAENNWLIMNLPEILNASDILRRYTSCFERCIKAGKDTEARTHLPTIKKACDDLGMDWRELLGAENERFFIGSKSAQKPDITDLIDISGSNVCACGCGRSMEGKKKGSKYF